MNNFNIKSLRTCPIIRDRLIKLNKLQRIGKLTGTYENSRSTFNFLLKYVLEKSIHSKGSILYFFNDSYKDTSPFLEFGNVEIIMKFNREINNHPSSVHYSSIFLLMITNLIQFGPNSKVLGYLKISSIVGL